MDLVGRRFGRLEVIANDTRKGYVICRCDCGNVKSIRATQLTKVSPVQSCGCIQKEVVSGVGSITAKKNFAPFYAESLQYHTNFHVIETDKPNCKNTSGYKGVWFNAKRGLWEAYISIHRKRIFLGRYGKKEDAIIARKQAEANYYEPLIQLKRSVKDADLGQQKESPQGNQESMDCVR